MLLVTVLVIVVIDHDYANDYDYHYNYDYDTDYGYGYDCGHDGDYVSMTIASQYRDQKQQQLQQHPAQSFLLS